MREHKNIYSVSMRTREIKLVSKIIQDIDKHYDMYMYLQVQKTSFNKTETKQENPSYQENIRVVLFVNISADIYSNAPFDKKKEIRKISGLFDIKKTKIRKIGCYFKKKASSYHSKYFFFRYF